MESYAWDGVIEEVTGHAEAGTLVVGQEGGLLETEKLLQFSPQRTDSPAGCYPRI